MNITNVTNENFSTFCLLINQVFNINNLESITSKLSQLYKAMPNHWYLLYDGEKAVGTIAAFDLQSTCSIGYVAIIDEYQKKGLGRLLMNHVMSLFSEKTLVLDSSPKGVKLYQNLGFLTLDKTNVLTITKPIPTIYNNYVFELLSPEDYDRVFQFDEQLLHMNRKSILLEQFKYFHDNSFVLKNHQKEILAYLVLSDSHAIAPLIATDSHSAIEIMQKVQSQKTLIGSQIIVPDLNQVAMNFFADITEYKRNATFMSYPNSVDLSYKQYVWSQYALVIG